MTSALAAGISVCAVIAPAVRLNCSDVEAVAVDHAVHVRRVGVERRPHDPPGLPVRIDPVPTNSTRACRMKSPVMRFQTKRNSSRWAHMLTPPAASPYSCDTAL
jgi:hypothetical protein